LQPLVIMEALDLNRYLLVMKKFLGAASQTGFTTLRRSIHYGQTCAADVLAVQDVVEGVPGI
jgi:hypothetical protein